MAKKARNIRVAGAAAALAATNDAAETVVIDEVSIFDDEASQAIAAAQSQIERHRTGRGADLKVGRYYFLKHKRTRAAFAGLLDSIKPNGIALETMTNGRKDKGARLFTALDSYDITEITRERAFDLSFTV